MSREFSLLVWLLIVVVVFFILRSYGVFWWASLVLSLLVAWFFLLFTYPLGKNNCDKRRRGGSRDGGSDSDSVSSSSSRGKGRRGFNWWGTDAVFGLITLLTVVLVLVFVFQCAFKARCPTLCPDGVTVEGEMESKEY